MKITVFTGNQPRHLALINRLSKISEKTYAVMECTTVFPGVVQDFFQKSEPMQRYFSHVMAAEKKLFGNLSFLSERVSSLSIKSGDLNHLKSSELQEALSSDVYVVFGASYIKSWLIDFLVEHQALNIHMGISPYYRGSSCNFWALYDNKPEYVGATIHMLSKGLDSGPILYHALPQLHQCTPFEYTMRAVEAAHWSLVERIENRQIGTFTPIFQESEQLIRYSKNADFNDAVVSSFLNRELTNKHIQIMLDQVSTPQLLHPFVL